MTKETTIDELAMMVQKGFQGIDEKMDQEFKKVNERIDGVDSKINTMTKQIDGLQRGQVRIEDRLDEMVPRAKAHERRITLLEKKVAMAR